MISLRASVTVYADRQYPLLFFFFFFFLIFLKPFDLPFQALNCEAYTHSPFSRPTFPAQCATILSYIEKPDDTDRYTGREAQGQRLGHLNQHLYLLNCASS